MEIKTHTKNMQKLSLSMFRKGFLGIFHGSISAKIAQNKFIINKKNAVFDSLEEEDFILLHNKKDYRWNEASIDSDIHLSIYNNIFEAKFIAFTMPQNIVSYSLNHDFIEPKDYFGYERFDRIEIYNPKNYDDWYERAPYEIPKFMQKNKTNFIVIKGYGIISYSRDLIDLAKDVALLDFSCTVLKNEKIYN